MSATLRYTVWAHTDRGDVPRSTNDPTMVAALVADAVRQSCVGTVTIYDQGVEVARGESGAMGDLDAYLAQLAGTDFAVTA